MMRGGRVERGWLCRACGLPVIKSDRGNGRRIARHLKASPAQKTCGRRPIPIAESIAAQKRDYLLAVKAYEQLVGTLYPSILYAELMQRRAVYEQAGGCVHDLPRVREPDENGRVRL